ncbi:hypothetical protein DFH07DRAFT_951954 [Mycena maculata]|uniref:Uncharacterized protein n=1 Tax=Mycena maculata TaxID=230809 RepID=A0AAD7K596_9AGAR|nr:hypothetical protein DFH07DRAFT_951954 [Mycena maculata]
MSGEYLPQFSRAILKDGQFYYLITVLANIPSAAMSYNSRVTATYRTMFFVSTVMVTNCMACRVFRNTKFGFHRRVVTTTELLSRTTRSMPMFHFTVPRSGAQDNAVPTVIIDTATTSDATSDADLHPKVPQI